MFANEMVRVWVERDKLGQIKPIALIRRNLSN